MRARDVAPRGRCAVAIASIVRGVCLQAARPARSCSVKRSNIWRHLRSGPRRGQRCSTVAGKFPQTREG
eukprot:10472023-Lingulodinium_polyedra.AAC.1